MPVRSGMVSPSRRRIGIVALFAALSGLATGRSLHAQTTEQFWPTVNLYVGINDYSRFYFQVQDTRENRQGQDLQICPYMDFYLKPMFGLRRENVEGADEARSRPLLFRIGYNYIPAVSNPTEQRIVIELTPRLPLKAGFVITDRNRGEFRFINGEFSTRYRNRLALERPVKIGGHTIDPYVRAEAYYDTRYNKWSQTALDIGAVFLIHRHWDLQSYFEHQNNTSKAPNKTVEAIALEADLRF